MGFGVVFPLYFRRCFLYGKYIFNLVVCAGNRHVLFICTAVFRTVSPPQESDSVYGGSDSSLAVFIYGAAGRNTGGFVWLYEPHSGLFDGYPVRVAKEAFVSGHWGKDLYLFCGRPCARRVFGMADEYVRYGDFSTGFQLLFSQSCHIRIAVLFAGEGHGLYGGVEGQPVAGQCVNTCSFLLRYDEF